MTDYKFSVSSLARLSTCDERLKALVHEALATSPIDFGIACGHRDQIAQEEAFEQKKTKVHFPDSKHNAKPSRAFDFYPVINGVACWDNAQAFKDVAHHILMTADRIGIALRWGGDWNCNGVEDEKFVDMPHIELKG